MQRAMNLYDPRDERGYVAVADHGLIGNLRTAALVSLDGSIESYCVPHFDSPSVFARILDKDKGGHFSVTPTIPFSTKQNYLPSSNVSISLLKVSDAMIAFLFPKATETKLRPCIYPRFDISTDFFDDQVLQTKFMNDRGVVSVTDFLPRPRRDEGPKIPKPLLPWLIRRIECVRGSLPILVQCAPAFNYARSAHITTIIDDESVPDGVQKKALFKSDELSLDLRHISECSQNASEDVHAPEVTLELLDLSAKGHKGLAVQSLLNLKEGQSVTFVLRIPPDEVSPVILHQDDKNKGKLSRENSPSHGHHNKRRVDDPFLTKELLSSLLHTTIRYWYEWVSQSTYTGSWKEAVLRSALALKLLIFEPTGAVVASPTFSLPEYIGGVRNWDYRATWIRDSSFTLYALIRLGFTEEANSFLEFIFERLRHKNPDGSINIMYTIHGGSELEEIELHHLDGHKGSRPVRIGNGAATHLQLDIYGELMDCVYLGQKFGKPLSYDDWVLVRDLVDFVVAHKNDIDLSIWEVRNHMRNFTFSKIMLWVAIDRGLRLADKRSLPCPNRLKWLEARDELYEEIMVKAWNKEGKYFSQTYEDPSSLDSCVLIMPLVFFMPASDPRFLATLKQVLKTPEKGGLTSNGLVYRYDVSKSSDGVAGEEGTFCMCTLWCIEALTRAGQTDRQLLPKAVSMFEDFLLYLNHVGLCTEEISEAGEALGNAVQAFTHVTLISAAYNLSRTLKKS